MRVGYDHVVPHYAFRPNCKERKTRERGNKSGSSKTLLDCRNAWSGTTCSYYSSPTLECIAHMANNETAAYYSSPAAMGNNFSPN